MSRIEYKWKIFFVTGVANLICGYAVNSMNLALPVMVEEFGADIGAISWISLVYAVVPTCTLLLFGRRADLYGYKKQFFWGFLFLGAVSLLMPGLSKTLPILIGFRALQGIGYAILISITQAMVSRTFPIEERGMALGVNSVFVSVGLASGPSVGGILLSAFNWQAIIYMMVPFCLLGAVTTKLVMREEEPNTTKLVMREEEPNTTMDRRMDWPGAAAFAAFVGSLIICVNLGGDWGVFSVPFAVCSGICGVSFICFILRETHTEIPMMQLSLFRSRGFTLSNITCMLSYMSQQMTTFLTPFFLINVLLLSENVSGGVMLATPLAMMCLSTVGGRMKDRFGSRTPAGLGLGIIGAGCLLMSRLSETTPLFYVMAALLCFGVGNGLSVPAVNASIFDFVPREHSGIASGMVATMRNLGQSLGVACGSAVIALRQAAYFSAGLTGNAAYLSAQRDAFYFGILVVAAALICVFGQGRQALGAKPNPDIS